jgi:hypothetical protein
MIISYLESLHCSVRKGNRASFWKDAFHPRPNPSIFTTTYHLHAHFSRLSPISSSTLEIAVKNVRHAPK